MLSLFVMARRGVESLGSLLFGVIASRIGTPVTLAVGGALCLIAVTAFSVKLPPIRQASRSFDEAKNTPVGARASRFERTGHDGVFVLAETLANLGGGGESVSA